MNKTINSLSLGALKCVREIIRTRSLTEAAKSLNISQPAASQYLSRFERVIGFPIVIRKGNDLVVRFEEAEGALEKIIDGIHELEFMATNSGSGAKKARIGISAAIAEYFFISKNKYLGLQAKYDVSVSTSETLYEDFKKGHIDLCFRLLGSGERDAELMLDANFGWFGSRDVLQVAENGPTASLPVILGYRTSLYSKILENHLREHGRCFHVVARVESKRLQTQMMGDGVGLGAVPDFLSDLLKRENTDIDILDIPSGKIRFAVFFHKKAISYLEAVSIFEMVSSSLTTRDAA